MTFTEEYVRGLVDRHGWGWLPMDQVTLTFVGEDAVERTVLLLPLGAGAATASAWVAGQMSRGLSDYEREGVWALVNTVNAACPEMNSDGRYYGEGEMFTVPPECGCGYCTAEATDWCPSCTQPLCAGHSPRHEGSFDGLCTQSAEV